MYLMVLAFSLSRSRDEVGCTVALPALSVYWIIFKGKIHTQILHIPLMLCAKSRDFDVDASTCSVLYFPNILVFGDGASSGMNI